MGRTESRLCIPNTDERLRAVAEILAAAVIRLRLRAALPDQVQDAEERPESAANCLEVPRQTVLNVQAG
jgi:hypothetical protein